MANAISIFSKHICKRPSHAPAVAEPPARIQLTSVPLSRPEPAEDAQLITNEIAIAPPVEAPIAAPTARPAAAPLTTEQMLLDILEAPLPPGYTVATCLQLKEEALGTVLATLSIDECRAMYKRLATPVDGDMLARSFATRLVGERRNRLLAFLADARRRQAIATARR